MRRAVVAMVLAVLVGASCTSTSTTSPSRTGSTSASTTSTTRPPSALDDLTAFFTAATDIDQKLKAAATDANRAIGTTEITISQSTLDAIAAADPTPTAQDIPAGLPPDVLLPVLTVQSDLVSRYYAFRGFVEARPGTTIPRANPMPGSLSAADYLLTCLGSGSTAAGSFSADMAAARIAASHAQPVAPVDPGSQAAADLAIWLRHILEANSGCGECGGSRFIALLPITWHHVAPLAPGSGAWDGDIGGLLFAARYTQAQGWTVQLNAC
ncbi:MAG TPA: hypothetical protein VMV22_06840 [Acidimicrobiales bacterium]|nr:hypothetical protein [Acidimicrobiales bacterium]